MELIKKNLYTGICKIETVEELELSVFEENNLKGVAALKIGGNRYLIKKINKYLFKYAAVLMSKKGRGYTILYNSNSIEFLKTCLITKLAVAIPSPKN